MGDLSEAINMDCMEAMLKMPDNAFDLLEADPPYFSGPEKRGFYGREVNKLNIRRVDYPRIEQWEVPNSEWFEQAKRVTKNQIIWGANYFDFIEQPHKTPRREGLQEWLLLHPKGWIVWDKCNADSSFNDFELAWTSFDRPTVVFRFMWNGMLQGKSINEGHIMQGNKQLNEKRIHPTQKPVPLYKWQFKTFAQKGDSILSAYLGSGSARIAAFDMGLNFRGFENSNIHFQAQEKRFNQYIAQLKLFATHD